MRADESKWIVKKVNEKKNQENQETKCTSSSHFEKEEEQ